MLIAIRHPSKKGTIEALLKSDENIKRSTIYAFIKEGQEVLGYFPSTGSIYAGQNRQQIQIEAEKYLREGMRFSEEDISAAISEMQCLTKESFLVQYSCAAPTRKRRAPTDPYAPKPRRGRPPKYAARTPALWLDAPSEPQTNSNNESYPAQQVTEMSLRLPSASRAPKIVLGEDPEKLRQEDEKNWQEAMARVNANPKTAPEKKEIGIPKRKDIIVPEEDLNGDFFGRERRIR